MFKSIGIFFTHVAAGFGHAWDQVVNKNVAPALGIAVHATLGFVGGTLFPLAYASVKAYVAGGGPLTFTGGLSAVISAVVGTSLFTAVKAAQTSPYQVVSQLAATVTPEEVGSAAQSIDKKVLGEVLKLNPPEIFKKVYTGLPSVAETLDAQLRSKTADGAQAKNPEQGAPLP